MKNIAIVIILFVVFALSGYMLTTQIGNPVTAPPAPAAAPTPETAPTPTTSLATPAKPAPSSAPVVAPAPPIPAAPAKKAAAARLNVSRIVIATAVEDRKPVGIATIFPTSQDKVYCYLELSDVTMDQRITYAWSSGAETENVIQQIRKSPRWRTWSVKPLDGKKGVWKVDILDESGNVLKSATFTVE